MFHYLKQELLVKVDVYNSESIILEKLAEKMAEYYQAAKNLLIENRTFLDKVTEELMRKKTPAPEARAPR